MKWISIFDKLPEQNTEVMTWGSGTASNTYGCMQAWFTRDGWQELDSCGDFFNDFPPTHWMPLPQEPITLGDFDNMTKAECVDYIEYLRKEIDLLRFKEWRGLSNDIVRAIGEKCEDENRGILNWIDFYNAIESMLKEKNYEQH